MQMIVIMTVNMAAVCLSIVVTLMYRNAKYLMQVVDLTQMMLGLSHPVALSLLLSTRCIKTYLMLMENADKLQVIKTTFIKLEDKKS